MIRDRRQILHLAKREEKMKTNGIIDLAPKAIRVAIKAIKFARGGFDAAEKKELGEDLLDLALELLQDLNEK